MTGVSIIAILMAVFMALAPPSASAEAMRIMRTGKAKFILFAAILFGAGTFLAIVFAFVLSL